MTPTQEATGAAARFVAKLNEFFLFPLITLLSAIALLVFLWGCAQYIMNATVEAKKEEGKRHIGYGLLGLFVMVSAYAILTFAANTFDLGQELNCADKPNASGCAEVFSLPE